MTIEGRETEYEKIGIIETDALLELEAKDANLTLLLKYKLATINSLAIIILK